MKINFVLNPAERITGGPLAILDYANSLFDRGHDVSVTTYPSSLWSGDDPFPWYKFKGKIHYRDDRNDTDLKIKIMRKIKRKLSSSNLLRGIIREKLRVLYRQSFSKTIIPDDAYLIDSLISSMPECDINIATWWKTAEAVYKSKKGVPVFFMQHFEPLFYEDRILHFDLICRSFNSYRLPMYKVANSSWLRDLVSENFGGHVRYSNNGFDQSVFKPMAKESQSDGIIRLITYSRPEAWKGFQDANDAVEEFTKHYGKKVIWNIFGYRHELVNKEIKNVKKNYHTNLSYDNLAKLYARCDIALCPSWYESFPLPPLEAMASGTSVITTRLGTEDFAFHESNCLVVNPRNKQEMVDALLRLAEDENLRADLAVSGRETASLFTLENAVSNREKILFDIFSESKRSKLIVEPLITNKNGLPFTNL